MSAVQPIFIPPHSARSNISGLTSARGPVSARSVSGHQAAVAAAGLKQWFALRQTTAGDATEEAAVTKALLSEVYHRAFDDAEALAVLPACPEIGWLVECHCRAPLAPGWRKSKVAAGDVPLYASEETGEVVETPPAFRYYVRFGELVVRARLDKGSAAQCLASAQEFVKELKGVIVGLEAKWSGPHADPSSGEEYWHNSSTGESTWDSPTSWVTFICNVAEALLRSEAFPRAPAAAERPAPQATPGPAAGASPAKCEKAVPSVGSALAPPEQPAEEGQDGDAWGALDALVELGGDQPKQSSAASARWADMEQWIATQSKPKAQPPHPQAQPQQQQPPNLQLKLQLPPQPQQQQATSSSCAADVADAPAPLPGASQPPSSLPAPPPGAFPAKAKLPGVPAGKSAQSSAPPPSSSPSSAPAPPKPTGAPAPPVPKSSSDKAPAPPPAPAPAASKQEAAPAAPAPPALAAAAAGPAPSSPLPPAPAPPVPPLPAGGVNPELARLARELSELSPSEGAAAAPEDAAKALELLEAIEKIPASFDDLRETKLGLITKPYKDSPDRQVKAAASRLRKAWKDMLAPKPK